MAKFQFRSRTATLEFPNKTYAVELNEKIASLVTEAGKEFSAFAKTDNLDEAGYQHVLGVSKTFIDNVLGEEAYSEITNGHGENVQDAIDIVTFIVNELTAAYKIYLK